MLKTESNIWYRKYSIELKERQFYQKKLEKTQERIKFLDEQNERVNLSVRKMGISEDLFSISNSRQFDRRSNINLCKACKNNLHPIYEQLAVEEKTRNDLLFTITNLETEGKRLIYRCKKLTKMNKGLEKQIDQERTLIKTLTENMVKLVAERNLLKNENDSLNQ